jgi:cysteine desulfuration protein SufE
MSVQTIKDDFELLDEWEDRYRYVIELGRQLAPLDPAEKSDANKVRGCASQVWLVVDPADESGEARFRFRGESDAHIVQGLIAILKAIYDDHEPNEVLTTDAVEIFRDLGLSDHLTPQRSNGLKSMIERIRTEAQAMAAG